MIPGRRSVPAVATLLLAVALAACDAGSSTATARWYVVPDADLDSDLGDVVPIVVEHRAFCEEYAGVDVVESDDAVEITVRLVVPDTADGSVCPDVGTAKRVDVPLDAPLGARALGGPGHEEPPAPG